jgi:hypothetical protein
MNVASLLNWCKIVEKVKANGSIAYCFSVYACCKKKSLPVEFVYLVWKLYAESEWCSKKNGTLKKAVKEQFFTKFHE